VRVAKVGQGVPRMAASRSCLSRSIEALNDARSCLSVRILSRSRGAGELGVVLFVELEHVRRCASRASQPTVVNEGFWRRFRRSEAKFRTSVDVLLTHLGQVCSDGLLRHCSVSRGGEDLTESRVDRFPGALMR
jgi:hypothetical protein